jgi:predicted amino acid racemase
MFLTVTAERNPALVEHAAWLHQTLAIPPNTYVIDADTVARNAAMTARAGMESVVVLNVMTKQYGRNPRVSQLIRDAGLTRFVAVDPEEARVLWRAGLDVTHVGHLVACSRYDVREVVGHAPEAITVFNLEQASWIQQACADLGRRQNVFLRMYDQTMQYHPGQHGGFTLDQLEPAVDALSQLSGITVSGVTSHPTLTYDYDTGKGGRTAKLDLLRDAAELVRSRTGRAVEINAPGVTCISTLPLLAAEGVTSAEPGSALTGSTPLHAFGPEPEIPAIVYVSEVSHVFGDQVFTFGGGFYPRGHVNGARLSRAGSTEFPVLPWVDLPAEAIDYYGELRNVAAVDVRPGDTAIYAFRNQVFVARSRVAVVEGLASGKPAVTGIYDSLGSVISRP